MDWRVGSGQLQALTDVAITCAANVRRIWACRGPAA